MAKPAVALLVTASLLACVGTSWWAYREGVSRGVELGIATGLQAGQLSSGVAALYAIQHLDAENHAEAVATLDSQVDAALSSHWIRLRSPDHYADSLESDADLVAYLEHYRRSQPSSARTHTPYMNRLVAEFLARNQTP